MVTPHFLSYAHMAFNIYLNHLILVDILRICIHRIKIRIVKSLLLKFEINPIINCKTRRTSIVGYEL